MSAIYNDIVYQMRMGRIDAYWNDAYGVMVSNPLHPLPNAPFAAPTPTPSAMPGCPPPYAYSGGTIVTNPAVISPAIASMPCSSYAHEYTDVGMRWNDAASTLTVAKVDCNECKGTGKIVLLVSTVDCKKCNASGKI